MAPVVKMYTLGHDFEPASHPRRRAALSRHGADHLGAGQRRLHRAARVRAEAVLRGGDPVRPHRRDHPSAGDEPRHPRAIDEALAAKETGEKKVILFNLSGHGHFDMAAYDAYLAGQLTDNGFSADPTGEVAGNPAAGVEAGDWKLEAAAGLDGRSSCSIVPLSFLTFGAFRG